jgi:hypothetical protein
MFRTARAIVIAVAIAVSLLGSASIASADPGRTFKSPPPATTADITWE